MKEPKIRELYGFIAMKRDELMKKVNLFGSGDLMCLFALRELKGMEEAFKIVAGMDVVDYMLKEMEGD